ATKISSQIAEGLAAAHAKKLIHRDIKPANILISESGRATLLDFGLAYAVDDNPQLTETGMIAGTPAYMSPEQAQGRSVDERSDLFSLGTVMYRMLTGEVPFTGKNALATILSIQRDAPAAPRQCDLKVPAALSDTVMDLLEKEPRERPESAMVVADALKNGVRPATQKTTSAQPAAKMDSGGFWPAIATLVAMGGVLAAAIVYVILTDKGKITIKTDDPNIQVKVTQNDNLITVIDPSTNDTVSVKSGTYSLALKDPNSRAVLSTNQLTVTRNGNKTVEVSIASDESNSAEEAPTVYANPAQLEAEGLRLAAKKKSEAIQEHVERMVQLRKDGEPAEAVSGWQKSQAPLNADQSLLRELELARCFKALGDSDLAIEHFELATTSTNDPEVFFEYGDFLESIGSTSAYDYLREAYRNAPAERKYADAYKRIRQKLNRDTGQKEIEPPADELTIAVGDTIKISVYDAAYGSIISDSFVIEPAGTVALGAEYGRVKVAGLTWEAAEKAIQKDLSDIANEPRVQVTAEQRRINRIIRLKYAAASDVLSEFNKLYPKSSLSIQTDQRSNTLVVSAQRESDLTALTTFVDDAETNAVVGSYRKVAQPEDLDTQRIGPNGESLYDGKDFRHWRSVALRETKRDRVVEALTALNALLDESNRSAVCATVFETMRRFGPDEDYFDSNSLTITTAKRLLSRCDPKDVAQSMMNEFGNTHGGNLRSRNFIRHCWLIGIYTPRATQAVSSRNDLAKKNELWLTLSANSIYFWNRANEIDAVNEDQSWAASTQALFLSQARPTRNFQLGEDRLRVLIREMVDLNPDPEKYSTTRVADNQQLAPRKAQRYEVVRKITACCALARHSAAHRAQAIESLAKVLVGEAAIERNFRLGSLLIFQNIRDLGEIASPLTEPIVDVLPRWIRLVDSVDSDGYEARIHTGNANFVTIIESLGNIGPKATSAIPILKKYTQVKSMEDIQQAAVIAIQKIQAQPSGHDSLDHDTPGDSLGHGEHASGYDDDSHEHGNDSHGPLGHGPEGGDGSHE
ncbi:MAG: protein kinase, partial [Planctomycetota bacterium]